MVRTSQLSLGGILAALLCFDPALAQDKAGSWEILPDLPNPRRLLAAATIDGRIYTFGGCGSPCFDPVLHPSTFEETLVEVYDPSGLPDDSWSVRDPIPSIFFSGAAAALEGFVYLAGGVVSANVLLRYDPATDSWTARASMPTPRHGLAMAGLDGKLYAVGGNGHTNALEVYDPATDAWTSLAPMPTPRIFLGAAALDGKLYVVGGSPDCCGDSQTDVLEIYDPATDSWTTGAPMPVAQQLSAVVAVHGQIYTFGGFIPGIGANADVYGYNPVTNSWTEKTPMPTARDQSTAVLLGDAAHVLGGSVDCHCAALDSHERYVAGDGDDDDDDDDGGDDDGGDDDGGTPRSDLTVTKTNGLTELPGCFETSFTYTVVATNLGPDPASGATLEDVLPDSLTWEDWSCDRCTPAPGATLDCVVDLSPGESVTCSATGTGNLDPDAIDRVVNTATVEPPADVVDPDLSNNSATDDDPIGRQVDLAITKTNGVDTVGCAEAPPYVITVTNLGPCSVSGAIVDDVFPPELVDPAWTCEATPGATCTSPGSGSVLHDIIDLPAGGTVTYTVVGDLDDLATGRLINTATVEAPAGAVDFDLSNNSATDDDPIEREADLAITKTNGVEAVYACERVDYEIEVTNLGVCPVVGARVTDVFPEELEEISDLDEILDLDVGESMGFTAAGIVAESAGASLSNTAHVIVPEGLTDPDPSNNEATDKDTVRRRAADLEVVKDRDDVVLWPGGGDVLTYTIVVVNHGPEIARKVLVTDDFPEQLQDLTWTCNPASFCDGPGSGDLAEEIDLDPGASVTYAVTGTLDPFDVGRICNTATLATMGCFADPVPSNDTGEACLIIPDCNSNGIRDAIDIESGFSSDLDENHVPDECQSGEVDWELSGVAEGGTVEITFEGIPGLFPTCEIVVPTRAGQTAETVAANIVAAINADPCLDGQDVEAMTMGASVWMHGFLLSFSRVSIEIFDPGLMFEIPLLKIPTLSVWGLGLLSLLIAAAAVRVLAGGRQRRRGIL